MAILAPEDTGRKLPPVGSPTPTPLGERLQLCGNDGRIRTGSQKLLIQQSGFCPNNPSQRIPVGGFVSGGGGQIPPTPGGGVVPPVAIPKVPIIPPPPIAKIPQLPPLPPLPPPPLPPGANGAPRPLPSAPGASGGGGAGGGIMLLIGLAVLASFGRRK